MNLQKHAIFFTAPLRNSLAFRSVKYGYANSRTKAMRSTLLAKKDLEALIESKNTQEIVGLLSRTSYSQDLIQEAVSFSRADLIEIALTKNFSRTLKKLVKISPKDDSAKISEVFKRYDILNIKNVLLGVHLREPKQKTHLLLIDSPSFSQGFLKNLADSTTIKEVVEKLKGTQYYLPLSQTLAMYEKNRDIGEVIFSLESYYHKQVSAGTKSSELGKTVKTMLDSEIDAKNIMTILRGKKEGFDSKKILGLLIKGGRVPTQELEKMVAAKSVEEAISIQGVFDLSAALSEYKKNSSLVHFENALEQSISGRGLKELRKSVLSLSAIVGFLFLKEKEVKDVRKIVRTKEFGLPVEEIKKLVVFA